MNGFTVSAQLTKANPMADKGMSLGFHTRELPAEEKLAIMNLFQQEGWLLFSPDPIPEEVIPETPSEYESKTPSQRLRAVMFVFWKQTDGKGDFEVFYRERMEAIINNIKSKLE